MNVLLVGGSNKIMDSMINKLNKSNDRVYWLTGKKEEHSRLRVFEKYNFLYTDSNIKDIIEGIKPEVVLFMGAFDTNFDWTHSGPEEAVRYTTSLIHILSVYSMLGSGRFIYLSSQDVYDGAYANNIPESMAVSPGGMKASAISQGEGICNNYRELQNVDTVVLRLDHVYGVPEKNQKNGSRCFEMCLEALRTGRIAADGNKTFSMLYLNDAIELVYKVMKAEEMKQSCYHISSMEEISELQLAEIISAKMGEGIAVVDHSQDENKRKILDGSIFAEEYDQKIFTHYDEGVEKTVRYMKRHMDNFIREGDVGGSRSGKIWHSIKAAIKSLLPFVESLICFVPVFMLNNAAVGSQYFGKLDFYLLYVLLFALVHGQQQAIFSALLAVAGYCVGQSYGRSGYDVLLDYNTYVWMAQLFIVGMLVGYLNDQLSQIKKDKEAEIQYLNEKIEGIVEINNSNVRIKQNFEEQLVNQKDSLGKIYEITSKLEQYGPEEVLFYAARVLGQLMNSKDVAIYRVANEDYARLFSATSVTARKLGNSIKYTEMNRLYDDLREGRVYINKTMTDKLPMMASAVSSDGRMQLILMIWGIPWKRMTLAESNRLTVIGMLIQGAMLRASRYLETLRSERYIAGTNILAESAFTPLVKAFFDARERRLTECALLEIQTKGQSLEQISAMLGKGIRETDYIGVLDNGGVYVLLSNTNANHVQGVVERIQAFGYESCLKEEEQ